MIKELHLKRISALLSIIFWSFLFFFDLFILKKVGDSDIPQTFLFINRFLLAGFLFFTSGYFRLSVKATDPKNFNLLIWKGFSIGIITFIIFLVIKGFKFLLGEPLAGNKYILNISYHLQVGLLIPYLIYLGNAWKQLLLYQKSKALSNFWSLIELLFIVCIILGLLGFNTTQGTILAFFLFTSIITFIASLNQKWIAYINFAKKLQAVFLILGVITSMVFFFYVMTSFTLEHSSILLVKIFDDPFFLTIFWFVTLYAIISFLVLIFNLPTSSVLEEKEENLSGFQLLSQSVQYDTSIVEIINNYLEASMKASNAAAAWFDFETEQPEHPRFLTKSIDKEQIDNVTKSLLNTQFKSILEVRKKRDIKTRFTANIKDPIFKSILFFPLLNGEQLIGNLVLLKDVSDGFTNNIKNTLTGYSNQTLVSLANVSMLNETIQNERYIEERKIAARVQKSLLPGNLPISDSFEIASFAISADEVGGDYFDVIQFSEYQYIIMICDVSGKGTSAAFHLAQMKGLFYGLIQDKADPQAFMIKANNALSKMLSTKHFVTLSYFVVDIHKNEIKYARAGHCPTLFYSKNIENSCYLKDSGMGLGLYRSPDYINHIDVNTINYQKGDILFLYTDGIPEAKNIKGEELGFDKIQEILNLNADKSVEEIKNIVIDKLDQHTQEIGNEDDYSSLIVKFS